MKVIITKREIFSSKAGEEYVKCSAVSVKDGKGVEIFTSKKAFDNFNLPVEVEVDSDAFDALVKASPNFDVQYDDKGRLESMSEQ